MSIMMNQLVKVKPQNPRSLWRTLLAPMLLASLGLHGLLLLMPTGASDDPPIPPPDPEQDSVAITRVPPPGAPDAAATQSATLPGAGAGPGGGTSPARGAMAQPLVGSAATVAPPRPAEAQGRSQPTAPRRDQPQSPSASGTPSPAPSRPATPANPPAPSPPPTSPSRPLFDAEVGERLLAYVAALNLSKAQVERAAESIQNRFTYDPTAVTRSTFNTNKSEWESAIQRQTGMPGLTAEEDRNDFSTVYPQRVCLAEEPSAISIGALVNPDGSWRGEPTLLRSSGYGALDRKALQEIQTHRFAPAETVKAYVLTVEPTVDYGPRPCLDPNPAS